MTDRSSSSACFVCGMNDRRALVDVTLDDGEGVTMCGSHAVMTRRMSGRASKASLGAVLRDRRAPQGERRSGDVDTLAMALRVGFSGERRGRHDRRG